MRLPHSQNYFLLPWGASFIFREHEKAGGLAMAGVVADCFASLSRLCGTARLHSDLAKCCLRCIQVDT